MAEATNLLPPGDPDQAAFQQGNGLTGATPSGAPESFTITHNGQQVTVGRDEAIGLMQKGFDYTSKTQGLAAEREQYAVYRQLDEALMQDPKGTLERIGRAYGIDFGQPAQAENGRGRYDDDWGEDPNPAEERIARLEAKLEQQDRERMRGQLSDQLSEAEEILGENFDRHALAKFAQEHTGGNLAAAAAQIYVWDMQDKAAQGNTAAQAAKRDLPPTAGGSSAPAQGSVEVGPRPDRTPTSIREAFEMAEAETGYQFDN